jgi:hypothetical protein
MTNEVRQLQSPERPGLTMAQAGLVLVYPADKSAPLVFALHGRQTDAQGDPKVIVHSQGGLVALDANQVSDLGLIVPNALFASLAPGYGHA